MHFHMQAIGVRFLRHVCVFHSCVEGLHAFPEVYGECEFPQLCGRLVCISTSMWRVSVRFHCLVEGFVCISMGMWCVFPRSCGVCFHRRVESVSSMEACNGQLNTDFFAQ